MKRTGLYAGVGAVLTHYEIDFEGLALTKRESVTLPSNVQYAWPHASKPLIYVAGSNRVDRHDAGTDHHLSVLNIDPETGGLIPDCSSIRLSNRPVHLTTDHSSENLLVAFDTPSEVQVYRLMEDGAIGERVRQRSGIDWGIFGHQVRVTADNQLAILVTRGNPFRGKDAHEAKQTDPGALKVFKYEAGRLGEQTSIAPSGGYHFGARYLDFHPASPWLFVSLETQNKLYVFKREGNRVLPEPIFRKETLTNPAKVPTPQIAGVLQMHPNGRYVYCVNRGHIPVEFQGKKVLVDVDNTIAVFSINQATGEPTLIQHIDSGGVFTRTLAIDASGKLLVACNPESHLIKEGNELRSVPANLALFEVRSDGTLELARKYDAESGPKGKLWMFMTQC